MNNAHLIHSHVAMARSLSHQALAFARLELSDQASKARGQAYCMMNAARRLKADACR
jgi:hypothetical protein